MRADLIGRDFRYTATGGTLSGFPYLPSQHIDFLRVMVTRPMVTIEDAELSGLDGDAARMSLRAQLGQREDKTIKAIIDVTEVPIEQMLPAEVASAVHGRMTGHVTWDRDKKLVQQGWTTAQQGDTDRLTLQARDAAVAVASANITAQEAQLRVLNQQKAYLSVIAPFDGVIAELKASVGGQVSEGTALVRVEKTED